MRAAWLKEGGGGGGVIYFDFCIQRGVYWRGT